MLGTGHERLDADRRHLDRRRAELAEARAQGARLGAGAGDDHGTSGERASGRPRDPPGERRGLTDHDHGRRTQPPGGHLTRDGGEGRREDLLLGKRAVSHDRDRLVGRTSCGHQRVGDAPEAPHRHEQHERSGHARQRRPVGLLAGLVRVLVAGDDREPGRDGAMRDRDARVGGRGDGARDARDDLERDPGGGEHLGLLAAAAEDERVATFQPHDRRGRACGVDERRVDLVLRHRDPPGRLPGVHQARVGPAERKQRRGPEAIVHDDVGPREQLASTHREQARIAGPGADEVDGSGRAHPASTPARRSPRPSGSSAGPDSDPRRAPRPSASSAMNPTIDSTAPSSSTPQTAPIGA